MARTHRIASVVFAVGTILAGLASPLAYFVWPVSNFPWLLVFVVAGWAILTGLYLIVFPERIPFKTFNEERKRTRRAFYSLNHGTELVYWVGRDNRILDVNDRLSVVMGYSRQELIAQSPSLIDEGWVEAAMGERWATLAAGSELRVETVLRDKEGRRFPARLLMKFFQDERDAYLCVFAHDISEQTRVSIELKNTKELFELYLQGLPVGAFVRNEEGTFLYVNDQFQAWNPGLEPGDNISEIFTPEKYERVREEDRLTLDAGPQLFLDESTSASLPKRWFEIHKFPIRIPTHPPMVGGVVTDVTVRREFELRLLENQAFLEATINQSPVGIVILDGNTTKIKICNTGAREILGLSKDENVTGEKVVAGSSKWQVLNPDGSLPAIENNPFYKAFFHENTSNDKMIIRKANGEERFVMINSSPIYDTQGDFVAAFVAFLDITELRDAQDKLQDLNRTLEQMVENRTRELSQSNEALKVTIENLRLTQDQLIESEKLASLGSLVAGVAHEINTPVGVGVTAASYLKEQTLQLEQAYKAQSMRKSDLEAFLVNAVQSSTIILSNLERASNLIKSFKLISVDQSTDQRRRFKPKEYFQEIFVSLHPPDKRLHVKLSIEGDDSLVLTSYPGTYSQIITNLFMNSCLHGFEGRSEGEISLSFRVENDKIVIVYKDSGVGMDETTLKRIFEPFFTTRRDLGGSGLGMNIVFNLVNQKLGGVIRVASSPGKGAEFTIEAPLEPPVNPNDLSSKISS